MDVENNAVDPVDIRLHCQHAVCGVFARSPGVVVDMRVTGEVQLGDQFPMPGAGDAEVDVRRPELSPIEIATRHDRGKGVSAAVIDPLPAAQAEVVRAVVVFSVIIALPHVDYGVFHDSFAVTADDAAFDDQFPAFNTIPGEIIAEGCVAAVEWSENIVSGEVITGDFPIYR